MMKIVAVPTLIVVLLATLTNSYSFSSNRKYREKNRKIIDNWKPSASTPSCTCSNPEWCKPIDNGTPLREKELFGFKDGSNTIAYNWTHITSLAWGISQTELCTAHQHGVKVIMGAPSPILSPNTTEREVWIKNTVAQIVERGVDGITFDYESPIPASSEKGKYYAQLIQGTREALHKISPSYQVTVCVAWSPDSIDGRSYPIMDLADASDALYVMDYDTRSQIFDACLASANAPYPGTIRGIQRYLDIGVSPDKLILGIPWYGYHYPCLEGTSPTDRYCEIKQVPFRGVNCSDAAGAELALDEMLNLYNGKVNVTASGYDENMAAPWFNTFDGKQVEQYWYDSPTSLTLKYKYAKSMKLRGVGPL
jgi:Di-N-acetylchitobiase